MKRKNLNKSKTFKPMRHKINLDVEKKFNEQKETILELEKQLKDVSDILNRTLVESDTKDKTIEMLGEELEYLSEELLGEDPEVEEPILFDSIEELEKSIEDAVKDLELPVAHTVRVPLKATIDSIIAINLVRLDRASEELSIQELQQLASLRQVIS